MGEASAESASNRIVASIMARNPSVKDAGFRKAIRAQFPDSDIGDCCRFVPDAFHISPETETVTLIEVVDTNPIDAEKADKIADFSFALDDIEWEVVVLVLDYVGNVSAAVAGVAFSAAYTQGIAPPNCRDLVPAAKAVTGEIVKAQREWTPEEMDELAARINTIP